MTPRPAPMIQQRRPIERIARLRGGETVDCKRSTQLSAYCPKTARGPSVDKRGGLTRQVTMGVDATEPSKRGVAPTQFSPLEERRRRKPTGLVFWGQRVEGNDDEISPEGGEGEEEEGR